MKHRIIVEVEVELECPPDDLSKAAAWAAESFICNMSRCGRQHWSAQTNPTSKRAWRLVVATRKDAGK
jgi:hypothetical protein